MDSKKNIEAICRLTPTQEGMLFYYLNDRKYTGYHVQNWFMVNKDFDANIGKASLNLLVKKHAVLRTVYTAKTTNPLQVVKCEAEAEYKVVDYTDRVYDATILDVYGKEDLSRGFSLEKDVPLRIAQLQFQDKVCLLWSMHHIAIDGWSNSIIQNDFLRFYVDLKNNISKDTIMERVTAEKSQSLPYKDYIDWIYKQDSKKAMGYWVSLLESIEEATMDSYGKCDPLGDSEKILSISGTKMDKIRKYALAKNVTISTIVKAAYGIVISRMSGSNNFAFGEVVSGRDIPLKKLDYAVGLYINTIPVKINLHEKNGNDLLMDLQHQFLESQDKSFCSLADIKSHAMNGNEIAALYVFENYFAEKKSNLIEQLGVSFIHNREETNYGLTLNASLDEKDDLSLKMLFDNKQFSGEYVARFLEKIDETIQLLITDTRQISEFEILSEKERTQILEEFAGLKTDYPKDSSIVKEFKRQVQENADKIAIKNSTISYTYKELDSKTDSIASYLIEEGVKPNDFVVILAERSLDFIVVIISILKTGAVYVPIDAAYPKDRIEFILNDINPSIVIADDANIKKAEGFKVINLYRAVKVEKNALMYQTDATGEDLAYVMYTSGTSGKPKGALIPQKAVLRLVKNTNYVNFNKDSIVLQLGAIAFDASTFEIWGALLCSGTLVVADSDTVASTHKFAEFLAEQKINTMFMTTSLYNMHIDNSPHCFDSLDYLCIGGEKASEKHVRLFKENNKRTTLVNGYGPTENTTFTACLTVEDNFEKLTIGKPIANSYVYIINNGRLCGIGEPGELCCAGDGLFYGYWNRPELNKEKYIDNPYAEGKMYRTGDLVRWLPDGNIDYRGRIDNQVKIRGLRIELSEIESNIKKLSNIKDVVVRAVKNNEDTVLCAYVVADEKVDFDRLQEILLKEMPAYLVPINWLQMDSFPLTYNGKLDARKLPDITNMGSSDNYVAPVSETQKLLCECFQEVLSLDRVGIKDSFFELGGHSLRAMRLINLIEAKTGKRFNLHDIFEFTTVEKLEKAMNDKDVLEVKIEALPKAEFYELSSMQKRLYLVSQMEDVGTLYNMPLLIKFKSHVDYDRVCEAARKLIDRHESLRTGFLVVDNKPVQKVYNLTENEFNISNTTLNKPIEKIFKDFIRPFNFSEKSLFRVCVVNDKTCGYVLLDMHHIISDGMSMNIIATDFVKLYDEQQLSELTVQYKDYVGWANSQDLEESKNYWLNEFKDGAPVLDFPLDHPRPHVQKFNGDFVYDTISKVDFDKIQNFVEKNSVTAFDFLISIFAMELYIYSMQKDIVIGTVVANRPSYETEKIVGMFVNTIAIRLKEEEKVPYLQFLNHVHKKCVEGLEHSEYPLDKLIEQIDINRDRSRNPLFDVLFVLQNNEDVISDSYLVDSIEGGNKDAKFDMTFTVCPKEGEYKIELSYATSIFSQSTMKYFLEHYMTMLKRVLEDPTLDVEDYSEVSKEEKTIIEEVINDTKTEFHASSIPEEFEKISQLYGDKKAVVEEGRSYTYNELDIKSNYWAHKLIEKGVQKNDCVIILAEKSLEFIVAIMAILKAGAIYVPIDTSYPKDRKNFIIEDVSPKIIFADQTSGLEEKENVIMLENIRVECEHCSLPFVNYSCDDPAYIIYTSGTSGRPKGSIIPQKGIYRLIKDTNYISLDENSNISQTGAIAFDASTFEIWGALLNGGTLFLIKKSVLLSTDELKETFIANKINVMFMTTSLFNMHVSNDPYCFNSLKVLLTGGEEASPKHFKIFKETNPNTKLFNMYGPTENTTYTTSYEVEDKFEKIFIGKPITNTQVYVVRNDKLCGIGVPGELCCAGSGLSYGYFNRPDLTAEKFIDNPYGEGKIYKTGDIVRFMQDENIEFLGRKDGQIKLRGFRIELEEIRKVLYDVKDIIDCVITLTGSGENKAITAYYVCGEIKVELNRIKVELKKKLPDYMIPTKWMQLEQIPINENGKVDLRALPEINMDIGNKDAAPTGEKERLVCEKYENVLGITGIGVADDFFELGGDSIKIIQLKSEFEKDGYTFKISDFVSNSTVSLCAEILYGVDETVESQDLNGEIVPLPVMSDFLQHNYKYPDCFNQSVLIPVDKVDEVMLEDAINYVYHYHDALNMSVKSGKYYITKSDKRIHLFTYSLIDVEEAKKNYFVKSKCIEIKQSFKLDEGMLFGAALFKDVNMDYLFLTSHHICVDYVSWHIIGEDIKTVYSQLSNKVIVHLPEKTVSIKDWSDALYKYSETDHCVREIEKFRENLSLYNSNAQFVTNSECANKKLCIDSKTSGILSNQTQKILGIDVKEALLTAITFANKKSKFISVSIESHGRAEIENVNPNRTVGWFTSIYPIVLQKKDNMVDTAVEVKKRLHSIEKYGIAYGIGRYVTKTLPDYVCDICFNYFGGSENSNNSQYFETKYEIGEDIASDNNFCNEMNISGYMSNSGLVLRFVYDTKKYNDEEIENYIKNIKKCLHQMARTCFVKDKKMEILNGNDFSSLKDIYKEQKVISVDNTGIKQSEIIRSHANKDKMSSHSKSELCVMQKSVSGTYDTDQIITALRKVMNEQYVLRTGYDFTDNNYVIYPNSFVPNIFLIDAQNDKSVGKRIATYFEMKYQDPVKLAKTELLSKFMIIRYGEHEHSIHYVIHHEIWDLKSTAIFNHRLEYYLKNPESEVKVFTVQKTDIKNTNLSSTVRDSFVQKFTENINVYKSYIRRKLPGKYYYNEISVNELHKDIEKYETLYAMELARKILCENYAGEYIPIALQYHGRNKENAMLCGNYIQLIPLSLYKNKSISVLELDEIEKNVEIYNQLSDKEKSMIENVQQNAVYINVAKNYSIEFGNTLYDNLKAEYNRIKFKQRPLKVILRMDKNKLILIIDGCNNSQDDMEQIVMNTFKNTL